MALKLARTAGCKVIITSSSDEKLVKVQQLESSGTISVINYRTNPEWDQEVLHLNAGVGVDVVLENGGTPTLLQSLNATAKKGIVSQIGYLGRQDSKELDGLLPALIDKAISLR